MMHWFLPFLAAVPARGKAPPLTLEWVTQAEKGVGLEASLGDQRNWGAPVIPLAGYARFYQRERKRGHDLVRAVYLRVSEGAGIRIEPLPVIFDGGCSIISLTFEYATQRVQSARCNGLA